MTPQQFAGLRLLVVLLASAIVCLTYPVAAAGGKLGLGWRAGVSAAIALALATFVLFVTGVILQ